MKPQEYNEAIRPEGLPDPEEQKLHYGMPEGYLEALPDEILSRLPNEVSEPSTPVNLWTKLRPSLYLAASFVGLYFCIQWMYRASEDANYPSDKPLVTQMEEQEYLRYYESYALDAAYEESQTTLLEEEYLLSTI